MSEQVTPAGNAAEALTDQAGTQDQGDRQERRDDRVRGRLREAEAERDQLRQRYGALVDTEVTRVLAEVVTDPAMVLRAAGKTTEDFLTDAGTVDAEAIVKFAKDFTITAPGFRRGLPELTGDGQRKVTKDTVLKPRQGAAWSDVLAGGPGGSEG